MRRLLMVGMVAASSLLVSAPSAHACGGFFYSASPVDQNVERIVFAVDQANDTSEMIVPIAHQGEDDALAWPLPVGAVPPNRKVRCAVWRTGDLT